MKSPVRVEIEGSGHQVAAAADVVVFIRKCFVAGIGAASTSVKPGACVVCSEVQDAVPLTPFVHTRAALLGTDVIAKKICGPWVTIAQGG